MTAPLHRPPPWTETATCTQHPPHLWHSPNPHDQAIAVLICTTCPVRPQCLNDYGHEPEGIIAALTPTQRGRLLATNTTLDTRPAHGTRSRYIGSNRHPGCRCTPCHKAHATYEREARARRNHTQQTRNTKN